MTFFQARRSRAIVLTGSRGRRSWRPIVACIATLFAAALVSPATSLAARSDCDQIYGVGTLCLWQNTNFTGTLWAFNNGLGNKWGQWYYVGNSANDQASSLWNDRNLYVSWVADNAGGGPPQACIGVGAYYSNLSGYVFPPPPDLKPPADKNISGIYLSSWRTSCPTNSSLLCCALSSTPTPPPSASATEANKAANPSP
jgi:hypothetical protein